MKLGLVTDCLASHSFDELLDVASELELECLEFTTGCWGAAPHLPLDALLASDRARRDFLARLRERGLAISALNCSGNPLHPGPTGPEHARTAVRTLDLAAMLGVQRVVMMSGCPGGPGDRHPNWVTVAWPPEATRILRWQWDEVLLPYWRNLAILARQKGVRLCLELHGQQNVYSVDTFFRLRDVVGDVVGVNLDPSHLLWMGADPITVVEALGECVYHVHAKDTRLDDARRRRNGRIETATSDQAERRSWNFVTVGTGQDARFWRCLCRSLAAVGYDDACSIEHEDVGLTPLDGVRRSVGFLRAMMVRP